MKVAVKLRDSFSGAVDTRTRNLTSKQVQDLDRAIKRKSVFPQYNNGIAWSWRIESYEIMNPKTESHVQT